MDNKKRVGFIIGEGKKDTLNDVMIYTITDETKLEQCKLIAEIFKNTIFISLTTELFYVYKNGEFKMVVPKHLKI